MDPRKVRPFNLLFFVSSKKYFRTNAAYKSVASGGVGEENPEVGKLLASKNGPKGCGPCRIKNGYLHGRHDRNNTNTSGRRWGYVFFIIFKKIGFVSSGLVLSSWRRVILEDRRRSSNWSLFRLKWGVYWAEQSKILSKSLFCLPLLRQYNRRFMPQGYVIQGFS